MYKTQHFKLCQIVTFLLRPHDLVLCFTIVSRGNSSSWTCVEKQISVWIGLFFTLTGDSNPFLATREPKSHLPTPTRPDPLYLSLSQLPWYGFWGESVTLFLMFLWSRVGWKFFKTEVFCVLVCLFVFSVCLEVIKNVEKLGKFISPTAATISSYNMEELQNFVSAWQLHYIKEIYKW